MPTDCVGLLSYLISVSCISSVRHIIIALLGRRRLQGFAGLWDLERPDQRPQSNPDPAQFTNYSTDISQSSSNLIYHLDSLGFATDD